MFQEIISKSKINCYIIKKHRLEVSFGPACASDETVYILCWAAKKDYS